MKKIMFLVSIAPCILCADWQDHWINAIQFKESERFEEAEKELDEAIKIVESNLQENIMHIYVDRAKMLAEQNKWNEAIADLDFALWASKENVFLLTKKDRYDAILCRSICYYNVGMEREAIEDYNEYEKLNPCRPKFHSGKRSIVRHAHGVDQKLYTQFCIDFKFCEKESDVHFYEDGVIVVDECEKTGCRMLECKQYMRQCSGEPPKTLDQRLKDQIATCKWYCDQVFGSALAWFQTKIRGFCAHLGLGMILDKLKDECHQCCDTGDFYGNCIQPIKEAVEDVIVPPPEWRYFPFL